MLVDALLVEKCEAPIDPGIAQSVLSLMSYMDQFPREVFPKPRYERFSALFSFLHSRQEHAGIVSRQAWYERRGVPVRQLGKAWRWFPFRRVHKRQAV